MKKYKCLCGQKWFSDEQYLECPYGNPDEKHRVKEVRQFTAEDYAELWSMDLENENRHSLTDMPGIICSRLIKHIGDRKIVTKIMKDFYNMGLGL